MARGSRVAVVAGACAIIAAALAGAQMFTAGRTIPIPDALTYFEIADQIQRIGYGPALPLHWSPLYPLFLLALRRLAGRLIPDELALTAAGDAFLLVLACVVVVLGLASIARRCWPDRPRARSAWVACGGAGALFLCFGVLRVGLRMPDAIVTATAFAVLVAWSHALDRQLALRFAGAAGALSGVAFLARANLLHWSIGVALVATAMPSRATPGRRVAAFAAFAAGLLLFVVPHVIALSHARGHLTYGESGKIVFAETYGARWPPDGHRWPVRTAAGDVLLFPDPHDVSFPGFYDPGREYDDATIPFSVRSAVRGLARAVQSTLLGYWTPSFALMWPLFWALWPIAAFGPGDWRVRPRAGESDRAAARARIGWFLVLAGAGGLAMHLASVSIGYYLPPYVLAVVVGAALLLLNTDDPDTPARRRALGIVAIGFVLAVSAVTASQFRWAAARQRIADRLDSNAIAAALSSLPQPEGGRRRVAVVGEWLGLYGVRISDSQVLASVPDEQALADPARRERVFAALEGQGIVALLCRRDALPLDPGPGWTALPDTPWTLFDLQRLPRDPR